MYYTKLVNIIKTQNIKLKFEKLNNTILGCYYSFDGIDLIVIDKKILDNKKLLNIVIAEELGHYFTTVGENSPHVNNHIIDTLNHLKIENKALKWASNFLVPTKKLLNLINQDDSIKLCEISDYFEVTHDFLMKKFYYMSLQKSQYKLSKNKYLILSNFPSIFIYRKD